MDDKFVVTTKSDEETKTAVTYTVTPVVNADDTTTVTIALVDLINIIIATKK